MIILILMSSFISGPAVIVYNERGHRSEDEDLDVYPEDDTSSQTVRNDRYGSPSSRPRTPINPYYPHSLINAGGSGSRSSTAVLPDGNRTERSTSRGYAPSIAPSTSARSTVDKGAYYSDSEKRRVRDREDRFDDRSSTAHLDRPRNAGSMYGASPISRVSSTAVGDPYTSPRGSVLQPSHPPSYPPSVRPPNSRSVSFHDAERTPSSTTVGEQGSANQDWGTSPKSAVDEQRQSYGWGNPPSQTNSQSAQLDTILNPPQSPFHQVQALEPPVAESRPKSPFVQDFHNDGPRSAFGDAPPSMFGGPPSMFGDTGPAADAGHTLQAGVSGESTSLFGEPPASVFGETAGATQEATVSDSWGVTTPVSPAVTPVKKGKKKASATATPASGVASRISPLSGVKSAFADESASSPVGGTLGSKGASPYDKGKPLSPLNPASQMNNLQVAETNNDAWEFNNQNAGEFSNWDDVNLAESAKQTSRAPSPGPALQPHPEEPAIQKETGGSTGKKKTKKDSTATTPSKSPNPFSLEEELKKSQQEQEAQARKDEEDRQQAEATCIAEEARIAEEQAAEKHNRDQQENNQASEPASLFGNNNSYFSGGQKTSFSLNSLHKPSLSVDTGDGNNYLSSWGFGGKKKKGKGATPTGAPENNFASSFGWGGAAAFGETSAALAPELSSEVTFRPLEFGSGGHSLGFDIDDQGFSGDLPQAAPSNAEFEGATAAPVEDNPAGNGAENVTGVEDAVEKAAAEDEGAGDDAATTNKKKKKKKKADAQDDAPITSAVEAPPTDSVPSAEPAQEEYTTAGAGKKKKKKK